METITSEEEYEEEGEEDELSSKWKGIKITPEDRLRVFNSMLRDLPQDPTKDEIILVLMLGQNVRLHSSFNQLKKFKKIIMESNDLKFLGTFETFPGKIPKLDLKKVKDITHKKEMKHRGRRRKKRKKIY